MPPSKKIFWSLMTVVLLASLGILAKDRFLEPIRIYKEAKRLDEKKKEVDSLVKKFETLINVVPDEEITLQQNLKIEDFGLRLPPGLSVSLFAQGLGRPRDLEMGPNNVLLVSDTSSGNVFSLSDRDKNGVADTIIKTVEGLNIPHGLAIRCANKKCKLYVADTDHVTSYDYDSKTMKGINEQRILYLQTGGLHVTRSLLFLPPPHSNQFLISVGSTCNACIEKDWQRGKILISDADGQNFREYASGLRNSVFMTLNPRTKAVWATDMGRDLLGNDLPPDELNVIEDGKKFGWPLCYGQNIHDSDYDKNTYFRNPCMEPFATASKVDIPAHSAPLGLAFFPATGWPTEYKNDLLVSYHGSWNRQPPTGYKVVRVKFDDQGKFLGIEDFITGWIKDDGTITGRPVDLLFNNKNLFLSDDKAGVVYRINFPQL